MARLQWIVAASLMIANVASAKPVTLSAEDGTTLHAESYGGGESAVLFVHEADGSGADYDYHANRFAAAGFHVLTLDLRGHGQSSGPDSLSEQDYAAMTQDVNAAVAWLVNAGATKVGLIGSRVGANLALTAAANNDSVTNLVMLSPGFNIQGVTVAAINDYGQRPLLLVSAEDDAYATRTCGVLEDRSLGDDHWHLVPGAASGTRMLSRDADLEGVILSWLNGTFRLTREAAATGATLSGTGDMSEVETTGKHIGER